jgi:sialic acid synthase SpsE/quercetin dioxygenase-like cupin family protein
MNRVGHVISARWSKDGIGLERDWVADMKTFDFKGLFVLDLANNHQGDVEHGLRIIDGCAQSAKACGVRAAVKVQFRNLETFIHPEFQSRTDMPHIPRFLDTALSESDYEKMVTAVRDHGLVSMATPFDETSVALIERLGLDIIKIASCSAMDYPLLERVASAHRPVIVSTAGLSIKKIDRLVSFLEAQHLDFALMHCVALYPTPRERLNLNQIALLRARYPGVTVGFSTHEEPDNLDAVRMAVAKGAVIFERHVGCVTPSHKLNAYSSTPDQVQAWMMACLDAQAMCGGKERAPAPVEETASLHSLMRGVYAHEPIQEGEPILRESVFFAMPLQAGQMASGNWRGDMKANRNYAKGEALEETLASFTPSQEDVIFQILLQVKGMLSDARIPTNSGKAVELSHHYGLNRFREFGCVLIDCVNRTYCKKLIVMLPRQKHPYHYHAKKEETFQLLYGDLEVCREGHHTRLALGDTFLIEPGMWHKFHTLDGAVFEEISTTHYNDDSYYDDEQISKIPRENRKTKIDLRLWNG